MTFFNVVDFLTSNLLLPLGGLFIAIFAAWRMSERARREELALGDSFGCYLWRFLLRYVTPIAVVVVVLNVTGVMQLIVGS